MRRLALLVVLSLVWLGLPVPAFARGVPETLAKVQDIGSLHGRSEVQRSPFPIEYLGVSWTSGTMPKVRFLVDGSWSDWELAREDDMPTADGRTFSRLVSADGASAYQVVGNATALRATAINTTDGPRPWVLEQATADASVAQPNVISRAQWGADESYRFNTDGSEKWAPAFYPVQKLIVHHTDGVNNDPDPAATIRAIYRYHAIDKGWGDIGYNFLVDAQGRVYKGRYSGPPGTINQDTSTGENAAGQGVTGAHTSGYNSGTVGIAVLGTYTSTPLPDAARSALVDQLAWETDHHALDPQGSSTFTNPVSGAQKFAPNITGHRDWVATECPGGVFYNDLPAIRRDVAARNSPPPVADTTPPSQPQSVSARAGKRQITIAWQPSTDGGGSGLAGYEVWRSASSTGTFTRISTTASTSYVDGGRSRGVTYWYYVVAFDGSGNRSSPSAKASARAL